MHIKKQTCILIMIMAIILVPYTVLHAAGGDIQGIIKIVKKDGSIACGDWIRVLLVTEQIEIQHIENMSNLKKYQRMESILTSHMEFYIKVTTKMNTPEYITASTLTRPDGTFKFVDITPGQYYILVTFPSMIKGYKVAWQLPVQVHAGKTEHIELTDDNFALPSYSRD